MKQTSILAFSSSRVGAGQYLEAVAPMVKNFLGDKKLRIAFLPFASVTSTAEEYSEMVRVGLGNNAYSIEPVNATNARATIENAEVIMVGGGNTFKLLHDIYKFKLLDLIRDKVNDGVAYIGWSAGANILGPTISTTNDMPIIEPASFNALGLLPFQLNPHYTNEKPAGHNGETRDQRLEEFLQLNEGVPIVALPEGTALQLEAGKLQLLGGTAGTLFTNYNQTIAKESIIPGADISFLL